jgi:transcriptional regulator with XRE-family HTH domain
MPLPKRIKDRRKHLEMSQSDLATAVLVSPGSISHYESGKRSPSVEVLLRLAMALRCKVGDLFDEFQEPPMVVCPNCSGKGVIPETVAIRNRNAMFELVQYRARTEREASNAQPSPGGEAAPLNPSVST